MRTHRTVPFVTLTLALISTVIKIVWLMGRDYSAWITANLDVLSWPTFYDQPWRVFTSPFVHRDIAGFLVNTTFLLLFGWQIERKYGWAMFLGLVFGALVSAYILWTNVAHDWIVGISIGVCGLFGFSPIANRRSPWWTTVTHRPVHALYLANLIGVLIANVTNLIPGRVAHLGHLFGTLYGMAFGAAFLLTPRGGYSRALVIALPILLFASLFYSPWQGEWWSVKRPPQLVTAEADCRLRLDKQETYPTGTVTFVNASAKLIALYWFDYDGNAQYWFWLKSGDSREEYTYIGHPWCIVDVYSGKALQVIIATKPEKIITFR